MNRTIYKGATLLALLFSAVGCATPAYKTADNLISQQEYRSANRDTTTIASIKWQDYYEDTYLQSLLSKGIENNLDIELAISRLNQAAQYFKKAKVGYVPTFSAGGAVTFGDNSENGANPLPEGAESPISLYQLSLSASWEIDIWGKISSSKRAAYASLLQNEAVKNGVITSIISQIATSYYQLLVLDTKLKVSLKTVDNYNDYLETVKVMKEQGQTNEVAVLQAKSQLYGVMAYIPEIKASIENTENYLSLLIGEDGGKINRASSLNLEELGNDFAAGVPTQLLQYRPDVIAAELSMRAAHESFNVAKASMYPALTLGGNIGFESLESNNWFDAKSIFWNAVGGLTAPLFNGRALRTAKKVAELQTNDAYINFRKTLLTASNEVSAAVLQSRSSREKAKFTLMQYRAIDKAYNFSLELFEQGYATYLDVLSAQIGLFSTELSLYDSYFDVAQQKVELYRALGGGWAE